ncbi:YhcN/YlaJ family sporulation lipoprotein [Bacillus salitolerans]|uniref:YhcN/YlaJ family sporulation lipoprotein n=1 Tax=Bacillus salitolerans TaxID=1437434 RepID=A0ABW4LRF3_9BACI
MKKPLLLVGIAFLSLLTACQYEAFSDDEEFYSENGKAIHLTERNETYNENNLRDGKDNDIGTKFGFVRHQKSPIPGDRDEYYFDDMPALDREKVADIISKMAVLLPNVNDVATLVTDEEVLVAYETDSANRFETADQIKKTAISVVPRYFHVYVSDNPRMIREIEKYGQLDSNSRDIDSILDVTIKEMLNDPQGRKLNDGENANGEAINEINEGNDEDLNQSNPGKSPVNMYNRDARNTNNR